LPPEYPFKPPHIIFLTPSGRFEVNTKVCLSFSAYHPELWQPAWGIRLILEALISFLPTPADGAIGSLDWSSQERKRLATASQSWKCPHCGPIGSLIPPVKEEKADGTTKKSCFFAKEIAELHRLQQEAEAKNKLGGDNDNIQVLVETDNKEVTSNVPNSLDMEADEEEIVFDDDNNDDDDDDDGENKNDIDIDHNRKPDLVEVTSKGNEATLEDETPQERGIVNDMMDSTNATTSELTSETELYHQPPTEVVDDTGSPRPSTISWMYDPLLNILTVLLIAICYLLVQKWLELSRELQALEAWEYRQQLEHNQLHVDVTKDEAVHEL
jgi:ubiquitin-conjugating enzyme E2 J1